MATTQVTNRIIHIIDVINTALKAHYYKDIKFNNISQLVEKDGQQKVVEYRGDGDSFEVGFDDANGLNIYHRYGSEITFEEDKEAGFGRNSLRTETHPLILVAFGNSKDILDTDKDINYKIADEIQKLFPERLARVDLQNVGARTSAISITSVNVNKKEVVDIELPDNEIEPHPENILFSISYEVVLGVTDNCKDLECDEVPPIIDLRSLTCAQLTDKNFGLTNQQLIDCGFDIGSACDVSTLTCQELNDDLTQVRRQQIQRVNPIKSGQLVSFRTGDDGDLEAGRLPTFFTLSCNNSFGHTFRFSNLAGDYFDPADTFLYDKDGVLISSGSESTKLALFGSYVIDHATGLGWHRLLIVVATPTWNNCIDAANSSTVNGFSDWRMFNVIEGVSIRSEQDGLTTLGYLPFGITTFAPASIMWTSNTYVGDTTLARALQNTGDYDRFPKTNTVFKICGLLVRNNF